MTTTTAPKFRKVDTGLYGTGLHTTTASKPGEHGYHFTGCDCDTVEMMIDNYTNRDGWYQRWVCPCGNFSDVLGEWFPTLRDAKAYITRWEAK